MIAYAEAHFALSGAATSAFVGAAGLGGLVMPWTLGQLFDAHGPGVLPPVTLVACLATIAAGLWVRHIVQVSDRSATAGDVDERAGHVAGRGRSQPHDRLGDLVRRADALHRDQRQSSARRGPAWRVDGSRSRSGRVAPR